MSKKVLHFDDKPTPDDIPMTSGQNVSKKQSKFRQDPEQARFSDKLNHGEVSKTDAKIQQESKKQNKSKLKMDKPDTAKTASAVKSTQQKRGLTRTAAGAARIQAWMYMHDKIYQQEHENVGIKAAHRTELAGESVAIGCARLVKKSIRASSARRTRAQQRREIQIKADKQYKTMLKDNPEMKTNAASRLMYKRKLKKMYQKKAREATKKSAAKTAVATQRTTKRIILLITRAIRNIALFIKTNPIAALVIAVLIVLALVISSCVSSAVQVGNSLGGAIIMSTYPSEDSEMLAAEASYAAMEAALQYRLDNFETLNPDYDEYHYDLDEIWHDPYALISILSAMNDGAWTLGEVQGTLAMLFDMQYKLTITVTTEKRTDPDTDEEYDYKICKVELENFILSRLPVYIMSEERLSRYAIYIATLGNRPDLFSIHDYPNASVPGEFERYPIPPEALKDPVFRAMIKEAEKYLGYPYVWGGSNPSTSFDCSGYVSWVINNTFWSVGRQTADGLYRLTTRVSPANARPGDLVFFWKTYKHSNPSAATHVGIYVGDGMMIHCGNPISYTSINTTYWQNHFLGFGRLP